MWKKATDKLAAAGFNWYDVGGVLISAIMLGGQIAGIWLGNKAAEKRNIDLTNKLMAMQKNATPPTTPNE